MIHKIRVITICSLIVTSYKSYRLPSHSMSLAFYMNPRTRPYGFHPFPIIKVNMHLDQLTELSLQAPFFFFFGKICSIQNKWRVLVAFLCSFLVSVACFICISHGFPLSAVPTEWALSSGLISCCTL